jgi:rhamnosyltransferase
MIQNNPDNSKPDCVYAIVVTYEPDLGKLDLLYQKICTQVSGLVVVDNGSSTEVVSWLQSRDVPIAYEVIALGDNKGIAFAQNTGMRHAKAAGTDYIVLFDHDSEPNADMVTMLLNAIKHKQADGRKVAAAGPRYRDSRQHSLPPFVRIEGLRLKRIECADHNIVEVDYLIASGCLIPIKTLDQVGLMRDDLFIDYVDTEWGLRAKTLGFQSFGVCDAHMNHSLGGTPISFRGKVHPLHHPSRHYYQFRNAVRLYQERDLPLSWKLVDGYRMLRQYIFYSIFAKPRFRHWRMMTRGVWHGLTRKSGPLR